MLIYRVGIHKLLVSSDKMLIYRAGIHKLLVRTANREGPDQTASQGQHCLSRPFWQASTVRNLGYLLYHYSFVYPSVTSNFHQAQPFKYKGVRGVPMCMQNAHAYYSALLVLGI